MKALQSESLVNTYSKKYGRSRCVEDLYTPVGMIDNRGYCINQTIEYYFDLNSLLLDMIHDKTLGWLHSITRPYLI